MFLLNYFFVHKYTAQFPDIERANRHEVSQLNESHKSLGEHTSLLTLLSLQPSAIGLGSFTAGRGNVVHASRLIVPLFFLVYKGISRCKNLKLKNLSLELLLSTSIFRFNRKVKMLFCVFRSPCLLFYFSSSMCLFFRASLTEILISFFQL